MLSKVITDTPCALYRTMLWRLWSIYSRARLLEPT